MEDLFGQIECRSKSDSVVMKILRSAMDKPHEKLQFMEGPIQFLHERTTFYELAAILVEGGLNIVQQDTDILEGGSSKILSDLTEIKQWLQGRIEDMKQLIVEKDGELIAKLQNESKLRQALELKDRELAYLKQRLDPERMTNENRSMKDEATDRDMTKLKTLVDQQVLSLKQKLDDEKKILTTERRARRSRVSSPNLRFDFLDKEISRGLSIAFMDDDDLFKTDKFSYTRSPSDLSRLDQNVLISGMSSDIDILKETLALAFGRMQSAELLLSEKQWSLTIEREIELILVRDFINNPQRNFNVELKKKDGLLGDNWFDFVFEMRTLFHELEDFFTINDVIEKRFRWNPCPRSRQTTSQTFLDVSSENTLENDDKVNRSHHAVTMIKSQESIICKQCEEYNWLTKEVSCSRIKEDKEKIKKKRRIQDAIARLDNFTKRNHKFADRTGASYKKEWMIPKIDTETNRSSMAVESLRKEIEKVQEESDRLCFQISLMDDIYQILIRSLMKDVSNKKEHDTPIDQLDGSISSIIREDLYVVLLGETVKQWKENFTEDYVMNENRTKTASDDSRKCIPICRCQAVRGAEIPSDDFPCDAIIRVSIESLVKEDIYMVLFKEMVEAWKIEMDACAIESFIREDIYHFLITEGVKNMHIQLMEPEVQRPLEVQLCRSRSRRFNIDNSQECTPLSRRLTADNFQECTPRSRRLTADNSLDGTPRSRRLESQGDESLIQKLDSLLKSLEAEEDLMLKANSIIKEHSVSNSLVILDCEEMEERDAIEWLITDDESTFCSVSDKLERALHQLYTSKELLVELEQSLEVPDEFEEYEQLENTCSSFLQQEDDQDIRAIACDSVSETIMQFHQRLANVEHVMLENLESKGLRLEEFKRQVDTLAEPLAWIKKRKLLYKKAFISRCHNLRLAETEVDLLGDQVESLLHLLERIYAVLNRNATVLSGYFEVYDILKLIKIELNNGRSLRSCIDKEEKKNAVK